MRCDVLVVGGGLGGVSAALAAAGEGAQVVLTEETDWLGGQMTVQGVSALDEHRFIEHFGCTARYAAMREAIRDHYRSAHLRPEVDRIGLNPGGGWVSRLCFEPQVGAAVLDRQCREAGVVVLRGLRPVEVTWQGARIVAVRYEPSGLCEGTPCTIRPQLVVDATEMGEFLPLAGLSFRTGAEGRTETGEPLAPAVADPDAVQPCTMCFALEYRPGEDHRIPKPEGYETFRATQPYSLILTRPDGSRLSYPMFGPHSLWTYRRLIDGSQFTDASAAGDVSLINWPSNDFSGSLLVSDPVMVSERLQRACNLSLGFLYWLQNEAPRSDGGVGYPGLMLRPDVMDTRSGLAKQPYIRESRRIIARFTIRQQDIDADYVSAPRAAAFPDTVGIGWYSIDIHVGGPQDRDVFRPTLPFQIPYNALVTAGCANYIAAGKNIGTTHITSGAYRVHPVEWAIGEAAGTAAALGCDRTLRALCEGAGLEALQDRLVEHGAPLFWLVDVPWGHPGFVALQQLCIRGFPLPERLEFDPEARWTGDAAVDDWAKRWGIGAEFVAWREGHPSATRIETAIALHRLVHAR